MKNFLALFTGCLLGINSLANAPSLSKRESDLTDRLFVLSWATTLSKPDIRVVESAIADKSSIVASSALFTVLVHPEMDLDKSIACSSLPTNSPVYQCATIIAEGRNRISPFEVLSIDYIENRFSGLNENERHKIKEQAGEIAAVRSAKLRRSGQSIQMTLDRYSMSSFGQLLVNSEMTVETIVTQLVAHVRETSRCDSFCYDRIDLLATFPSVSPRDLMAIVNEGKQNESGAFLAVDSIEACSVRWTKTELENAQQLLKELLACHEQNKPLCVRTEAVLSRIVERINSNRK